MVSSGSGIGSSALSPDGKARVDLDVYEMRPSQWVSTPTVVRTRDNAVVFKAPELWDAFPKFQAPNEVLLELRCYDKSGFERVVIDVEAEDWWDAEHPGSRHPMATLIPTLQNRFGGETGPDELAGV
jgi:hypothetical protein